MKNLFATLAVILFTISCTTMTSTKTDLSSFDKGVNLMHGGEAYKAKKLWEILCLEEGLQVACWAIGKTVKARRSLAIMQGATDESSTQVAVLAPKKQNLRIYLRDTKSGKLLKEVKRKDSSRSHSDQAIIQLTYQGMSKGVDYNFVVVDEDGKLMDSRRLRTLLLSGSKLRFAVTSCMDDSYEEVQKSQWLDLVKLAPEVVLMIGDNVYVDSKRKGFIGRSSGELIWDRYVQTRQTVEFFKVEKLTPVFAVWDDHDYGLNNSGKDFAHKEEAKNVFQEFFPQEVNGTVVAKGPGVSQLVQMRQQNFLFLDNRFFRSAKGDKGRYAHFGQPQEKWLLKMLNKHKGPYWLINGGQFFGGYHPHESFEGEHPESFNSFLGELKKTRRRVVFVSGDRHLAEVMKIPKAKVGYLTYELTSSGIHATVFPGSLTRWKNPLGIEGVDGTMNYMMIESQAKSPGVKMKATSYGPERKVLFQRKLTVR